MASSLLAFQSMVILGHLVISSQQLAADIHAAHRGTSRLPRSPADETRHV